MTEATQNQELTPNQKLEAELEAIKAKRTEVAKRDADKLRKAELEQDIREQKLELEKDELRAGYVVDLGTEGQAWAFVPCWSGVVAVRAPHVLSWQRYGTAKQDTDEQKRKAMHDLLFKSQGTGRCLLYPETEQEVQRLFESEPGLEDAMGVMVLRLASASNAARLGK